MFVHMTEILYGTKETIEGKGKESKIWRMGKYAQRTIYILVWKSEK